MNDANEQHIPTQQELDIKENIELTLRNIFTWAWKGLQAVKIKMPVTHPDTDHAEAQFVLCILDKYDMDEIFKLLRRGINRGQREKKLEPIFTNINDTPDPEAEFERQLFDMKADLLDKAKKENDTKELLKIVDAITKIQNTMRVRHNIRKPDIQLITALAKRLDPNITEERVLEILEFESQRLKA